MIHVTKDQLKQVEYLIGQSIQGNHVLFDLETVRSVFWSDMFQVHSREYALAEAYAVEHHIERLILEPTLAQKRDYLSKLDLSTLQQVIRTYFNIVENNLYEKLETSH